MINYDQIAPAYDQRYKLHDYPGIRATLLELIKGTEKPKVLEVGCGTGKWLRMLAQAGCAVAGLDASEKMLAIARQDHEADLRNGIAENLPWPDGSFDLILYINALHHFKNPGSALREAFRVLGSGGKILSIGLDPHERIGRWYVYEFFPAALQLDLTRFPSQTQRRIWLQNAGFTDILVRVAEYLLFIRSYAEAVRDGSLERSFTSQLTALSDQDYSAGIRAIQDRANASATFRLEVDLYLYAAEARKQIKTNR